MANNIGGQSFLHVLFSKRVDHPLIWPNFTDLFKPMPPLLSPTGTPAPPSPFSSWSLPSLQKRPKFNPPLLTTLSFVLFGFSSIALSYLILIGATSGMVGKTQATSLIAYCVTGITLLGETSTRGKVGIEVGSFVVITLAMVGAVWVFPETFPFGLNVTCTRTIVGS